MSQLTAIGPRSAAPGPIDLKEHVLKRAGEFTMIPAAAMRAMEIARNPSCSVKEYAGAIERDVRLTADILSMANSSLYANGAPAASLHDAISRLGLRRCQGLILSTCTAGLMKQLPFQQSQIREALWRHGYLTAVYCRHLNETLRLGFNGEEFTAGLMHDLGRSLLAATAPEHFAELPSDPAEGPQTLEREHAQIGTDHCKIGAAFAARNSLPVPLVAVIRHHHSPNDAGEHQRLTALIAIADQMANRFEDASMAEAPAAGEPGDLLCVPFLAARDLIQNAIDGVTPTMSTDAVQEANRLIA